MTSDRASLQGTYPLVKMVTEEMSSFTLIIWLSGTKDAVLSRHPCMTALLPPVEVGELGVAAAGQNSEQI